jgi:hypothetical protein
MFTANMFGSTQVYSTRFNAERALAYAIGSRPGFMTEEAHRAFLTAYCREDYAAAITAYNTHVKIQSYWNAEYLASVTEVEVDTKFI